MGRVELSSDIVLHDVLYVPALKYNLLSVPKLTKDNKCMVIFHPQFYIIQDYLNKKILGVGTEHRGLSYLKGNPLKGIDGRMEDIIKNILETNQANLLVAGAIGYSTAQNSYEVWHKRMGHASFDRLRHLAFFQHKVKEHKVCITCPMAKFTRLPYTVSTHKSSSIWGPYRVQTHKGYRYFLTLVNDRTRTTWVYLLKHISQALSTQDGAHSLIGES